MTPSGDKAAQQLEAPQADLTSTPLQGKHTTKTAAHALKLQSGANAWVALDAALNTPTIPACAVQCSDTHAQI